MNHSVKIRLAPSGLGDRLLDMIGFYVICKCLGYCPKVFFNNYCNYFDWGSSVYDLRLFDFTGIELIEDVECPYYIHSPNTSSSLSPYKGWEFVASLLPELSFEDFSNLYHTYAKQVIRPSSIIVSKLPEGLENAYGIHLRRSDKVKEGDIRHENTTSEFEMITRELIEDIRRIIQKEDEPEPVFLIVSEDNQWKDEFHHIVNRIFLENNKTPRFILIDYNSSVHYVNYNGVLDMFCLSRCKAIYQGVKYSTFSMIASLIGNNKLHNYSHITETHDKCLIHTYHSAIEINGGKKVDIELQKKIGEEIGTLETNITQWCLL